MKVDIGLLVAVLAIAMAVGYLIGSMMFRGAVEEEQRRLNDQVQLYKDRWEKAEGRALDSDAAAQRFQAMIPFDKAKVFKKLGLEIEKSMEDEKKLPADTPLERREFLHGIRAGLKTAILYLMS